MPCNNAVGIENARRCSRKAPMLSTHFGSAICVYTSFSTLAIFLAMVPITINRSLWRGLKLNRSMPKNARGHTLLAMVAMNSMPQQLVAKGNGQMLFLRARPMRPRARWP